MTVDYKRTIIQVPLEDVTLFEAYAKKYGLSLSSAIVMLAKKSIEYEETLKTLPSMIEVIKNEQALELKRVSKTNKNVSKIKKK